MTRDVEDRIRLFAQCHPDDSITADVMRVALNMSQVEQMRPPENPAKMTDSRAVEYVRKFGKSSWELDAIEPKKLANLVSDSIAKLVDKELWKESESVQQAGRDYIAKMAREYKPGK